MPSASITTAAVSSRTTSGGAASCRFSTPGRPIRRSSVSAGGRCGSSGSRRRSSWPKLWLEHPTLDAYWKHGSISFNYGAITCPTWFWGGWADLYRDTPLRLAEHLKVQHKVTVGPWAHLYPHEALPTPAVGYLQEALRWWDRWLKGIDNGVMDEPAHRFYMMESVGPVAHLEHRPGRWVGRRHLAIAACTLADAPPESRLSVRRCRAGARVAVAVTANDRVVWWGLGQLCQPRRPAERAVARCVRLVGVRWRAPGRTPGDSGQRHRDSRARGGQTGGVRCGEAHRRGSRWQRCSRDAWLSEPHST